MQTVVDEKEHGRGPREVALRRDGRSFDNGLRQLFASQVDAAADALHVRVEWYSDHWVAVLRKDEATRRIIGYSFNSAVTLEHFSMHGPAYATQAASVYQEAIRRCFGELRVRLASDSVLYAIGVTMGDQSLGAWLADLASRSPTPGGGAVAALSAATGAALIGMVAS
jgi:hypothetical protein